MKLLTTPLTALSASILTWYVQKETMETQIAQAQARAPVVQSEGEGDKSRAEVNKCDEERHFLRSHVEELQQLLSQREQQISELQEGAISHGACGSPEEPGLQGTGDQPPAPLPPNDTIVLETKVEAATPQAQAGDPVVELLEAAKRVAALLGDMAAFGIDSVAGYVWQWPVDSSNVLLGSGAISTGIGRFTNTTTEWLEEAYRQALQLRSQVGPAAEARLASWLGPERSAALGAAAAAAAEAASDASARLAAALRGGMRSFFDRHPEYEASFGEKDHLLVLAALAVVALLIVKEIFGCLQVVYGIVRGLLQAFLWALGACLCCRKRRSAKGEQAKASSSSASKVPRSSAKDKQWARASRSKGGA